MKLMAGQFEDLTSAMAWVLTAAEEFPNGIDGLEVESVWSQDDDFEVRRYGVTVTGSLCPPGCGDLR